jgi:glutathione S-transferase
MYTLHHYWSSVCSQKARICLAEKGLDFQSHHVNLFDFEHWTPEYLKLNPKAVVPALIDDGKVVIESNVMLEYLEDKHPQVRLRPEDPYERALMRIWIFNSEDVAHPNVNTCSHNPRHAVRLKAKKYTDEEMERVASRCPDPSLAARFLKRLKHGVSDEEENVAYAALDYMLGQMEEALRKGPWLTGREYSLADIAMAPFINRIEVLKRPEMLSASRRPKLAEWWQRIQARPAYKQAMSFTNPDKSDPLKR